MTGSSGVTDAARAGVAVGASDEETLFVSITRPVPNVRRTPFFS
jgi:hypothetical protein